MPWPMPGDRVLVYDALLFVDDETAPLSVTMRPATVLRRYGCRSKDGRMNYPDVVDVHFDHRGESRAHFTCGVRTLQRTVGALS